MSKKPRAKNPKNQKGAAPSPGDLSPLPDGCEPALANRTPNPGRKRRCSWEHVPNAETAHALRGAEAGEGMTDYASVDEMFLDLDD